MLRSRYRHGFCVPYFVSIPYNFLPREILAQKEEQYLENLYDAARDNTTQLTYDLYVQNIQLICPQIINSNYVHTTKVIYERILTTESLEDREF